MGRSNRAQAEKNRQRIVDVADAAFRKSGTRAVTIADVMTQAGMTQGGFYKHFRSKDALVAEACMSAFNRSAETWKEKGHQPDESVDGSLERLIAHYFSKKPPEKTCPTVALAQDAAAHQANQGQRGTRSGLSASNKHSSTNLHRNRRRRCRRHADIKREESNRATAIESARHADR